MRRSSPLLYILLLLVVAMNHYGCRGTHHNFDEDSTTVTTTRTHDSSNVTTPTAPKDTVAPAPQSDLPPIATPLSPEKLASFIPQLSGYQTSDPQKEVKVHKGESFSKAVQTFTQGDKKFTIEINDFAYVPVHYAPYESFIKEDYLHEDNNERTETMNVKGYRAIQTWEKKTNDATITVFPGRRFVVRVLGDNLANIGEARSVVDQIDLMKLETLQ